MALAADACAIVHKQLKWVGGKDHIAQPDDVAFNLVLWISVLLLVTRDQVADEAKGPDPVEAEGLFCAFCFTHIVDAFFEFVLLLGDQPGVEPQAVDALRATAESADAALAVCRYDDGRGHPFWFDRSTFADLAELHGDKAVWKLLESGRYAVTEAAIDGTVPIDVDTWADYERLLEST